MKKRITTHYFRAADGTWMGIRHGTGWSERTAVYKSKAWVTRALNANKTVVWLTK